jgi:protein-tyrosine-phosphatase
MKILFVCTGNTCRSPMAASFLPEDVAESAGLFAEPGDPASPQAIQAALAAGGRDLSGIARAAWTDCRSMPMTGL